MEDKDALFEKLYFTGTKFAQRDAEEVKKFAISIGKEYGEEARISFLKGYDDYSFSVLEENASYDRETPNIGVNRGESIGVVTPKISSEAENYASYVSPLIDSIEDMEDLDDKDKSI